MWFVTGGGVNIFANATAPLCGLLMPRLNAADSVAPLYSGAQEWNPDVGSFAVQGRHAVHSTDSRRWLPGIQ